MTKYDPSRIERKWQQYWEAKKFYVAKDEVDAKKNFMLLVEFPYPSGNLHRGHWYAFALPDILGRYLRMKGFNVMYPIGFDAFGLPAENAAIERGINPRDWTEKNISYMTKQLKSMGALFDWSREVRTIDPEYYKWTQWIFLKFYEAGLAYRDKSFVNWCPKDKTVLANEQVVSGCCERCGTQVEQREFSQWMFKITKFADELIDDLENLDWPETAKLAQKNWIGRSEGSEIIFPVVGSEEKIGVFTTRADTLFGATYMVLAPEHPLIEKLRDRISNFKEVEKYIKESKNKTELERISEVKNKSGVQLEGIAAVNPINNEKISVWVADYVLGHYGTGAVMAVPAHDQRDYDFAKKYDLEIKEVIETNNGGQKGNKAFEEDGTLVNSGKFDGLASEEARKKITEELEKQGMGKMTKQYRLHDWGLSRQRYWGVPIPMVNCPKCGYVAVAEKDLPIELPKLDDFMPSDDGRSPLAKADKWLKTKCPKCGGPAERETDTMDTFVDSSWYFIRYTDPNNKKVFADEEKIRNWLPVPLYIGGAEHNTMHLLYSRFFTKALNSLGYIDFDEPFSRRVNHGIILGPDSQKMSKSRGNVVDPDEEVKKYGADTIRMYLAFMGPYEQGGPWDPKGIVGVYRFLNRVWNLSQKMNYESGIMNNELDVLINKTIKKIGRDIEELKLNTAVSALMILVNKIEEISLKSIIHNSYFKILLKLLAPFAPHIAEEIWSRLTSLEKATSQSRIRDSRSESGQIPKDYQSIHLEAWPEYDEALLEEEIVNIVVQVNGKVRDSIKVKKGLSEEEIKKLVLASEKVKKYVSEAKVKKFIYIKDRLTNIVI